MSGVTTNGFVPATYEEILAEQSSAFRAKVDATIDLSDASRDGILNQITAESIAKLWEGLYAVDKAMDPDMAEGTQLDALCALSGTVRLAASYSTATLTLTGVPGTLVAAGKVASNGTVGADRYETSANATIVAATAWAGATAYTLGARRTNNSKIYQVTTAGTSAGAGGPTGTGAAITDGTVVWRYLGDGTGAVDVAAQAQETGPRTAVAYTLRTIESPVGGWYGVVNALDVVPGRDVETDADLRIRRVQELASRGKATEDAILAALTDPAVTPGVTSAALFINDSDVTDVDGLPPHSFEALVEGGDNTDIARTIWDSKAAGIQTYGTTTVNFTDTNLQQRTVKFTRPTTVSVWIRVTIEVVSSEWPSDGPDQVKALVAGKVPTTTGLRNKTYLLGENVVASERAALPFFVSGVYRVVQTELGTSYGALAVVPYLVITPRQRALLDTTRVEVVVQTASTAP